MGGQRYEVLDGLRGVAAICVMLGHFSSGASWMLMPNSQVAVDLFFMLSGFVLFHSYADKITHGMRFSAFMQRRLIRLYPMLLAALVLGSLVLVMYGTHHLSTYPGPSLCLSAMLNLLFLPYFSHYQNANMQSASGTGQLYWAEGEIFPANPVAWSLFFELVASAAIYFSPRITRWIPHIVLISGIVLFAFELLVAQGNVQRGWPFALSISQGWGSGILNFPEGFLRAAFGFSVGIVIRLITARQQRSQPTTSTSAHGNVLFYLSFVLLVSLPPFAHGLYTVLLVYVAAPLLVYIGASLRPMSVIQTRVAYWLGWISYPLYCIHYPVGRLIFLLSPAADTTAAFVVAVLLSVLAAALIARWFDEPLRSVLTRRWLMRKPIADRA